MPLEGVPVLHPGKGWGQACFLLSQFELYIADTDNVARFCRQSFARGLIVNIRSVHAARILNVPGAIAKPEACVLGGYKAIGNLNNVGGTAPDIGLRLQIESPPSCADRV